ncbi:MAG: 1-(5-phosphoribosyl)-5-[(5-phosphoribosylamino)methylideneamino]imidazole-4-carboxamide isomerase [Candidatus Omnitrophica bacterium]|nr:1-(5-phosphoribosyl)-5-[(5-phosphoribosylamino)methylideneamino]imidazole-4-carboxamide isomerase [Candidatus Omnitrophota bacterium]
MIITPAIDIRKGNVVRLYRGLYNKETIYSTDPLSFAKKWKDQGAEILHVIDLDGAFFGESKNMDVIEKIIKQIGLKVHLGGGLRTEEAIKKVLDFGVHKVIISTIVFEDDKFLGTLDAITRSKVIVSIDSKAGVVLDKGWTGQTDLTVTQAVQQIEKQGVRTAVITDISSDGTLEGPNTELLKEVLGATKMNIISAGGISCIEDIKVLKKLSLEYVNLYGTIIGKALYENKIDLKEAINCGRS